MLVLVVYDDGTHDLIESYLLDYLITTGRIARFCRASGWVTVGRDPTRKEKKMHHGAERRTGTRDFRCPAHLIRS